MSQPVIEPGGRVLRGLAVPYSKPAIVMEPDGRIVAEVFDAQSIRKLRSGIPLLVGHDRSAPPAGIVDAAAETSYGVGIEGRLIGTDAEIEGWQRRFEAGLMCALSVGFTVSGRQQWLRPQYPGGPPTVIRRGVSILEVSLVHWGAYESAGIVSLNTRSAAGDVAHAESEQVIAEWRRFLVTLRSR